MSPVVTVKVDKEDDSRRCLCALLFYTSFPILILLLDSNIDHLNNQTEDDIRHNNTPVSLGYNVLRVWLVLFRHGVSMQKKLVLGNNVCRRGYHFC